MEPTELELSGGRQHLLGVAVDADIAPNPANPAVGTDQHRGSKNSKELPAVHGFFAPGAIGFQV